MIFGTKIEIIKKKTLTVGKKYLNGLLGIGPELHSSCKVGVLPASRAKGYFYSYLFYLLFVLEGMLQASSRVLRRDETEVLNTLNRAKRKKLYEPEQ